MSAPRVDTTNPALSDLESLRRRLVKARRTCVATAIAEAQNWAEWAQDVVIVQARIDAVDAAIADEKALPT